MTLEHDVALVDHLSNDRALVGGRSRRCSPVAAVCGCRSCRPTTGRPARVLRRRVRDTRRPTGADEADASGDQDAHASGTDSRGEAAANDLTPLVVTGPGTSRSRRVGHLPGRRTPRGLRPRRLRGAGAAPGRNEGRVCWGRHGRISSVGRRRPNLGPWGPPAGTCKLRGTRVILEHTISQNQAFASKKRRRSPEPSGALGAAASR